MVADAIPSRAVEGFGGHIGFDEARGDGSDKNVVWGQRFGEGLVAFVPKLLAALSFIGTIAMLWVGGGILVHGTHEVGFHALYDLVHGAEYAVAGASGALGGVTGWFTYAALSAVVGLILGAIIAFVLHKVLGYEGAH